MTALEVLKGARAHIAEHGHCRDGMYGDGAQVCTAVAIARAGSWWDYSHTAAALAAFAAALDTPDVVAWQDANETPAVLAAFDRAIATLEAT
jgi:hypothetical protein